MAPIETLTARNFFTELNKKTHYRGMYQNVGISDVSSTGREVKEVVGFKNGWL